MIPGKEINTRDRDSFWKKEEQEERNRVVLDKERQHAELEKLEKVNGYYVYVCFMFLKYILLIKERKQREEKENAERERRMAAVELSSPTKQPTFTKP